MASFQIHIDRENQVSNVRRLPDTKNTVGLHQKRSVLGNINSNSTIGLSRKPLKQVSLCFRFCSLAKVCPYRLRTQDHARLILCMLLQNVQPT